MSADVAQKLLDQVFIDSLEKDPSITFKKFEYSAKNGYVSGYNPATITQQKQLQRESLANTEIMLDNFFAILIQTQSLWTYANLYPRCFFVSPTFFHTPNPPKPTLLNSQLFIRDKDRIIFAKQDPSSKMYYLCVCDLFPQSITENAQINSRVHCYKAAGVRVDEAEVLGLLSRIIAHFFKCLTGATCVDYTSNFSTRDIVDARDLERERYHAQLAWLAQFFCTNHYCVHPDDEDLIPSDQNVDNCKKILYMGMTVFVEPKRWYLQKETTPNTGQITAERLSYAISESMKPLTQSTARIEAPLIIEDDEDEIDSTFSEEVEQLIRGV